MSSSTSTHPDLAAVESASNETAMILAACHSLVVVEEEEGQDGEDRAVNLVGNVRVLAFLCSFHSFIVCMCGQGIPSK